MKESPKIILNPDQIKIERMNNLVNVKNTLIKHSNSHYEPINPNVNLSDNAKFWVTDNGVFLK